MRELGGRKHAFAHNGEIEELDAQRDPALDTARFRPVGETDSERLFCELLARLEAPWLRAAPPTLAERQDVVSTFAEEARQRGVANFLYSDGEALFAHSHYRPNPEDATVRDPGLHILTRTCDTTFDHPGISIGAPLGDTQRQVVTLIASVPLSDEPWRPLDEGELLVLVTGQPLD